jgi:hypothetical protein
MLVALDWKRFEPPLKDVAAALVFHPKPRYVRGLDPLHRGTHGTRRACPQNKVEVVWHQAECEKADFVARFHSREQFDECPVVDAIQKQGCLSVPSVENVIAVARLQPARDSRHPLSYRQWSA